MGPHGFVHIYDAHWFWEVAKQELMAGQNASYHHVIDLRVERDFFCGCVYLLAPACIPAVILSAPYSHHAL